MTTKSYLQLVNECDNFPYTSTNGNDISSSSTDTVSEYYKFKIASHSTVIFGHIPPSIAKQFPITNNFTRDDEKHEFLFSVEENHDDTESKLARYNAILAAYLQDLRTKKVFKVLDGWRSELYPIYGPGKKLILSMERSATPLFGVVTYGVHMTAFYYPRSAPVDEKGRKPVEHMKIWTPRRALTKQTYPGMMDNTVAGGLSTGEKPAECLMRESMEEASLSEEVVKNAKACGTLTYHYLRGEQAGGEVGLSQPECQFIYDLEMPEEVIPKPNDNEAVDFRALSVDEVKKALTSGDFKPNCAHLMIEFFVRHGILTLENEPDYIEIVSRLHRRLDFPTM